MTFVKQPNLPESDVSLILADERMSPEIIESLSKRNIQIIKIFACSNLQSPVSAHPDMLLFYGGDGDIILSPNVYDIYRDIFKSFGLKVIKGKTALQGEYPLDIAYNAAYDGKCLICNEKYTDYEILSFCKKKNAKIINIRQGYAKCSVCFVSENAVITSDIGIYNELVKNGYDVLKTECEGVSLTGYNYGFIGGSCGKICRDTIAFCGNVEKHPEYENIRAFLNKYNCKALSLSKEPLYDYGSLISILTF